MTIYIRLRIYNLTNPINRFIMQPVAQILEYVKHEPEASKDNRRYSSYLQRLEIDRLARIK